MSDKMWANDYSLYKYNVYVDIRRGSLGWTV